MLLRLLLNGATKEGVAPGTTQRGVVVKKAPMAVADITTTPITLLCREIGPVNTARFLNQFTSGFGNYTEERDEIIGASTVDRLLEEIKQRRTNGNGRTKTVRGPSRPTKRSS